MLVPTALKAAASRAIRGASWMISPLLVELACRWMQGGDADRLLEQQRRQLAQRARLLRHHLGHFSLHYQEGSMHAWLELPAHWRSAAFIQACEESGVTIAGAELFAAGHFPSPQAVRLSISHPLDDQALEQALLTLRQLLENTGPSQHFL